MEHQLCANVVVIVGLTDLANISSPFLRFLFSVPLFVTGSEKRDHFALKRKF